MSREIKFRIWDRTSFYFASVSDLLDGYPSEHKCLNSELVFQQYTGLKDENGKEIYEGDILECYKNRGVVVFEDMEDAAFECVFIEDYLEGKRQGEFMIFGENFFSVKSKIIGNIFENPELLK